MGAIHTMNYIVIRTYRGATLAAGAARTLVSYALRLSGRRRWDAIGVDVFTAGGRSLLIARPAPEPAVRIADYALPLLMKYFTK